MKFLKFLQKHWLISLVFLIVAFWLGFFISEFIYNKNFTYYKATVETNSIDATTITSDFFKDALAKYKKDENGNYLLDEDGNLILAGYSYATVKPDDFFSNNDIQISEEADYLIISIKAKYFVSSQGAILTQDSYNRFGNVMNKVIKYYDQEATIEIDHLNHTNGWLWGLVSLALSTVLLVGIYFLFGKKLEETTIICDGETVFRHPFSRKYWRLSSQSITKMRIFDLCFIAILFALQMLCKLITIPSGFANLGFGITYLVFSCICLIYGPLWGLIIGFFSDVLGFFIFPNGSTFFFGYTIQAMLTGFVYGLFFYRTPFSFSKCLVCRLIVNIILNVILGSFLWGYVSLLTFEATIDYMLFISLPKNLLYLIPQSALMYVFLKAVIPVLRARKLIPAEISLYLPKAQD